MSSYEVFRVPNHERFTAATGNKRYPFQSMQVGDAFRIGEGDNAESIRVSAFRYSFRHSCNIVVRSIDGVACCIRIA